ncbi:Late exocytosis, associated with Golgi transport domain containing protein [Lactarius tabidus]
MSNPGPVIAPPSTLHPSGKIKYFEPDLLDVYSTRPTLHSIPPGRARFDDPEPSGPTEDSNKALLWALALNGIVVAAEIIAFTFMRRYLRIIYEPRSLSFFEVKRQPPLSSRLWGWPSSIFFADYRNIKNINGLDSYFFVRFLRMMVRIMLPIWLISWAVLLPLNSVNTDDGDFSNGLSWFTIGNIDATTYDRDRYIALLALTWIFTIWICCNIKHEMAHYVHLRQQYLVSSSHSSTAKLALLWSPEYRKSSSQNLPLPAFSTTCRVAFAKYGSIKLEDAATSLLNAAIKRNRKRPRNPVELGDGGQIIRKKPPR